MQNTLQQKVEAVTETLGIIFPGYKVGAVKDAEGWKFSVDGKAMRFSEAFLNTYDIDYILSMCHLAIAELRDRPSDTTINITAPAQLG